MKNGYIYKHAVIVGLDGMGNFNKHADTPNMDRIFADGAVTYDALSLYPTISAQNWGAMLIGTDPDVHGLTNSIVGRELYMNKELPTIFTTVRKAMPDSVLCSISDWDPINHGIVEHDIGVYLDTAENGTATTDKVVACVKEQKPTLLFIQIDDPDGAGHHYGYGTEGHLECINNTDKLVNRIHEAYAEAGILEDTLFIVITDHGGFVRGHGGYTDGEKYIFFALKGKTVKKNDGFFATTKDINAIIRHAFGIDVPEYAPLGYSSQVPAGVFTDCDTEYKTSSAVRFEMPSLPMPDPEGENGLYSFFPKEDFRLAMFFENDAKDELGKVNFVEHGAVKYYSNGIRGSMGEFGATGFLCSEDFKLANDDFTVAVWLKVDDAPGGECRICGNKTMTASGAGFMVSFANVGTVFSIETEDPGSYQEYMTPFFREVSGGWLHCLYAVSKKDLTVKVYQNFKLKETIQLPEIFDSSIDALPFTVGEEASHKENTEKNFIFNMDDLFFFNRAFDENDVRKLAEYYGL